MVGIGVAAAWVGCALGLLFGVIGGGLCFSVLDIGVYESFIDGDFGDWDLLNIFCIVALNDRFWHFRVSL